MDGEVEQDERAKEKFKNIERRPALPERRMSSENQKPLGAGTLGFPLFPRQCLIFPNQPQEHPGEPQHVSGIPPGGSMTQQLGASWFI